MHPFLCPVCRLPLSEEERLYRCADGHCFDKAAAGYVNLLMSQASSQKHHGDDKEMIRARTAFLSGGHYRCLSEALIALSLPLMPENGLMLDAGCGEGHYTALFRRAMENSSICGTVMGIDLSKFALTAAAKRKAGLTLAVASVFHLPVADETVDLLWDIFAPAAEEEYLRVLKKGGHIVRAYALPEHLMGLKEQLYDRVYENPVEGPAFPGMRVIAEQQVRATLTLQQQADIASLFAMTPYSRKTSPAAAEKLSAMETLTTPIAFGITVYRKD